MLVAAAGVSYLFWRHRLLPQPAADGNQIMQYNYGPYHQSGEHKPVLGYNVPTELQSNESPVELDVVRY